jgi:hypothetical protein
MDTNKLSITPQIVQSQEPSTRVLEIMKDVLFEQGMLASYIAGTFGSLWYVEVPRHLNDLYEEIGEQAVRDVITKLLDHETSINDILWDVICSEHDRPINF